MTNTELVNKIQSLNSKLSSFTLHLSPSLSDIDTLTEDLHRVLADIKSLRNSVCPIGSLPDELLAEIFFIHAESDATDYSYRTSWSQIMYVCRRWHEVVMNSSQLWTNIGINFFEVPKSVIKLTKLLELSKDRPINLQFDLPKDQYSLNVLMQYLEFNPQRVQSLVLRGYTDAMRVFFREVDVLPLCRILKIECKEIPDGVPLLQVTDSYLSGSPKLHSIAITDAIFNWNVLCHLTDLSVNFSISVHSIALSSLSEILRILERSPALETLQLYRVLPEVVETREQVYPVVNLPQLKSLRCSGMVDTLHALFVHLHIPADTKLEFITFGVPSGSFLRDFLVPLRRHLQRPGHPLFSWITLDHHPDYSQAFSFYADNEGHYNMEVLHGKLAQLTLIMHPPSQRDIRSTVAKILRAIPLSTSVNIDARYMLRSGSLTPKTWTTLFLSVPNLESIKIGVNDAMTDMLSGYLKVMQDGYRHLSGEIRRAARRQNWLPPGSSNLSNLTLVAALEYRTERGSAIDEAAQEERYNSLADFLIQFRDLDKPYKPRGRVFQAVNFERVERGYVRMYSDSERNRLFPLVGKLSIEGRVYDPAEVLKSKKRQAKWLLKMKKRGQLPESYEIPYASDFPEEELLLSSDSDF